MKSLLSAGLAVVLCLFLAGPVLSADGNLPPPGGGPQKRFPRAQELNCQADPNGCQQRIQELQFRLRQVELRVRELNDCVKGDCGFMQSGGRGQIPGGPGSQMPAGPGGQIPGGPGGQMPGGSSPVPPGQPQGGMLPEGQR